jgi:hypothetical protein
MSATKSRNGRKSTPTPDLMNVLPVGKKKRGRPPKVQPNKSAAQIVAEIDHEIARLEYLKKIADILR